MFRTQCLFLALVATVALGACGDTTLSLTADRTEISAGSNEFATLTAKVVRNGDPGANLKVTFTTSAGSFEANSAAGSEVQSKEGATDSSGVTTIKLYPPDAPGQATVTATYYDDDAGTTAESTLAINFTEAKGGNKPVDGTFRITCDAVNIGAFREPVPDIRVTCNVTAQSRTGDLIEAAAMGLDFRTEAGSISPADDGNGKTIFIYSPQGGTSAPKDVPPDGSLGEPVRNDNNGLERNPRDGLVTIIAIVSGEEAFTDTNGNGKYDDGEPFVDAAEPFVDANDNDKWDSDEVFIDTNGNGLWDPGNGTWDGNTKIMAIYKILWTGALHSSPETSRISTLSPNIFDSGKAEMKAYLLDANMNPVAAFPDNSDQMQWTLASSGDAISNDLTYVSLSNAYGLSFDKAANSERKRWKILPNSFTPPTFSFTVEDGYPKDTEPATNYSVSVQASLTPGPSGDGSFLLQLPESITEKVEGTCD